MKCPKCQNEINSNAKFCTKCGCNLAAEMAKSAAKPAGPGQAPVCAKCGANLMPGAKFCTKCGTPAAPAPVRQTQDQTRFLYEGGSNGDDGRTVLLGSDAAPAAPVSANPPQPAPMPGDIVPPADGGKKPKKEKKEKQPQSQDRPQQKQEKSGSGLMIAAIILLVLVVASGALCFLVWNGTIGLPAIGGAAERPGRDEGGTEEPSDGETAVDVDAGELFAETDELLAKGKGQTAVDAEIVEGMDNLSSAMRQFAQKAEEAGDAGLAADRIADAYASYVSAVIKHKDMMGGQSVSSSIYAQIMSEMEGASDLADELAEKGYTIDTSALTAAKDAFDTSYTEKIISTFDEFTSRTSWSRTEAWNLMSGFDSMFDSSDLDNPLRLRYTYALAWWVQKQIETELGNATITAKGAAIKIANMMEAMDYNPMMLNYYISYMKEAGEDCSDAADAYDEIVRHIAETQGITIGEDIPLDHFWYFNDFGKYSVDDTNGVTPENRQWIRERMRSVTFVKQ